MKKKWGVEGCEKEKKRKKKLFPAGLEPATFRVLGGRDNHYTTETTLNKLGPDNEVFRMILWGLTGGLHFK